MRIVTVAIDGFGQFHGAQLTPDAGLTVVRGPNEAGKTTLLAFARAMLFGFETNRYPALNGGKRGGWLDVITSDGRSLRIERYGERGGQGTLRVIEDDKDLGPGQLSAILQGVETSVYRNIFAFGLGELTRFETLKDDEVAARIYGAGLGTGGVSGLKVEGSLRGNMEQLFKTGGSKPALNGLLKRLDQIDRDLQGRDLPAEYAAAGTAIAALDAELAELRADYEELEAERRRQQRLKDGWGTWLELREAENQREELGEVLEFDADVLERLSVLEAALVEADKAVQTAARDRDRAQAKLEDAVVDESVLVQRGALETLREASRVEVARVDERRRHEVELADARTALQAALDDLGAGWTIERVGNFDDSIAVKTDISGRWRTELTKAHQAVATARARVATAEEQAEDAQQAVAVAEAHLAELGEAVAGRVDPEDRDQALRKIERLSAELVEQRRLAESAPEGDLEARATELVERRGQARELADAIRARSTAEDQVPATRAIASESTRRSRQQYFMPALLGVIGVVGAIVAGLLEAPSAVPIVVAIAGIGGAAAWVVALRLLGEADPEGSLRQLEQQSRDAEAVVKRLGSALGLGASPTRTDVERLLDGLEREQRQLEEEQARLERAEAAEQEARRIADDLEATAAVVELPKEPTATDLDALRAGIADDRKQGAAQASARERAEQLRAEARTQTKRVATLAAELESREAEQATVQAAWGDWLEDHDLDRTYDRETAGRVVDSITAAKGLAATQRRIEQRAELLATERDEYVEKVRELAPLLNDAPPADDIAATAALLSKLLTDTIADEQARTESERAVEDREAALAAKVEAQGSAQAELQALLDGSGTADAADLRAEVERTRQASRLDSANEAARATLTALSGPGKALARLLDDLAAVDDIADVEASIGSLSEQLRDLAERRDALNGDIGGLQTSRAEMEDETAATELRQERADLLARLQAGARRWSVLALAHSLLNRSRTEYEEAHRPAVVQKAEHFFGAWTDGRYMRIVAPLGEDVRGVERADGYEVPLSGLSRGTSEQLYLALRFGLVQHFVETSPEPLPIVMDDILVNFDADRAERAARSIEELSQQCQIIYFTCHDATPLEADLEQALPRLEVVS